MSLTFIELIPYLIVTTTSHNDIFHIDFYVVLYYNITVNYVKLKVFSDTGNATLYHTEYA